MFQKIQSIQHSTQHFFRLYGKYLPLLSFIGGFAWDSVTLTRIDRLSDNLILLAYILLLGIAIVVVNLVETNQIQKPVILRFRNGYPLAIQFLLGGLFSSYVVFYFKSAAVTRNWLFLIILVILLFANEFLEKRLTNIYLQFTLYFLVTFSFLIFFIPVITKLMTIWVFLFTGILSLSFIAGYLHVIQKRWQILKPYQLRRVGGIIIGLYLLINYFYFTNLIPPVPLALKFAGIYHQVEKSGEYYLLKYEKPAWYQFWKRSDNPFQFTGINTVYCFAAIFAPVDLKKDIKHHWQMYDPEKHKWIQTDRMGYSLNGGREAGYRGYTYKKNLTPGRWRVDVKTDDGRIIGRIDFKMVESSGKEKIFKISQY